MKPPWNEIKEAYQRGEGSCRELALQFGVNPRTLENRCWREKWRVEVREMTKKVGEKVVEALVRNKVKQIEEHEVKAVGVSEMIIDGIKDSFDQLQPFADPLALQQLSSALQRSNQVARLNLGAVDTPDKMEAPGGLEFQKQLLMTLATIRELAVKDPKILDISDAEADRFAQLKIVDG